MCGCACKGPFAAFSVESSSWAGHPPILSQRKVPPCTTCRIVARSNERLRCPVNDHLEGAVCGRPTRSSLHPSNWTCQRHLGLSFERRANSNDLEGWSSTNRSHSRVVRQNPSDFDQNGSRFLSRTNSSPSPKANGSSKAEAQTNNACELFEGTHSHLPGFSRKLHAGLSILTWNLATKNVPKNNCSCCCFRWLSPIMPVCGRTDNT